MERTWKGVLWHFLTWFVGGSGATIGYLAFNALWKKFVG